MSLPLITPDRIERWGVEDPDAPHRLPELIRRLIQTSHQAITHSLPTSPQVITQLEMASGRQVWLSGYDGIVVAGPYLGAGRRFVPVGRSVWEMGARKGGLLKKLQDDYKKRTEVFEDKPKPTAKPKGRAKRKEPLKPSFDPAETTFVLVTPHILSDKARTWAEERRCDPAFPWRHLEVYGAEELRSWLDAAPAVAAWFGATCLGIPSALMSLEGALEHLAARTPQRIPPHILLPERDAEAAAVRRWAEAALDEPRGRAFTLQASSEEEALAFVCAVLDDRTIINPHRETFHAQTLIARTREAWEYVLSEHPGARLLLLPMPEVAQRTPGERRVHALLPTTPPNEAEVILPPMSIGAFAGALVHKAGLGVEDANTYASQGNATWAGLVRQLAGIEAAPAWLKTDFLHVLVAALLLGSWSDKSAADCAMIEQLTDQLYADFVGTLEPLTRLPDPPLLRDTSRFSRRGWRWVHRRDAWRWLEPHLTSSRLERFGEAIRTALSVPAPQTLGTPKEMLERYHRGDYPPAAISDTLRAGIFEALRWLAEAADMDKQDVVRCWVRDLLPPVQHVEVWLTLGRHLDDLATLDSEGFMSAARRLPKVQSPRRDELIQSSTLLDALAGLARREPLRCGAIIQLLWTLEELEPKPEHGRSKETTQHLVKLLLGLDAKQQQAALQRPSQEDPDRAWALRIKLCADPRGQLSMLLYHVKDDAERQRIWSAGMEALRANADQLIRQTQQEPARWPEVLEQLYDFFWLSRSDQLADALEKACAGPLEETQRDAIAWALRQRLEKMLGPPEDYNKVDRQTAWYQLYDRLLTLYKRLVPGEFEEDGEVPIAWLFRRGRLERSILAPQAPRTGYKETEARRQRAIQKLLQNPDAPQALKSLVEQSEPFHHSEILRWAAGAVEPQQEEEILALPWSHEQRASLLWALSWRHDKGAPRRWLSARLRRLNDEARAGVLTSLPLEPETVDAIIALPKPLEVQVWQQHAWQSLDAEMVERIVCRLMDLGLPLKALAHLIPQSTEGLAAPQLSTMQLHQLLEEAGEAWVASIPPDSFKERYNLELSLLHAELFQRNDRDTARLIQAEQHLVHSLTDPIRSPGHTLAFFKVLAEDGAHFMELSLTRGSTTDPEQQRMAEEARALVRAWTYWIPHQRDNPIPSLRSWLNSALARAQQEPEEDHTWVTWSIDQVLIRLPADPIDGVWPHRALREVLEDDLPLKEELLESFYGPDAGGSPDHPGMYLIAQGGVDAEREVKRRKEWLKKLEYAWPTAAEAVRMSLSYWADEVTRRDRDAELLRQRRFYSLTEGQEGHLTFKQAQEAGLEDQVKTMLEAGVLQRVGPGVYRVKNVDPGDEAQLLALWLQFEQEGVFSHGTALGLLNISTYEPFQTELTLPRAWEARGVRPPPGTTLYYEDIPRSEVTWRGSVPTTTPARTLEDCASVHIAPDLLEQAVEEGLRRGRFTRDDLPKTLAYLAPYRREAG